MYSRVYSLFIFFVLGLFSSVSKADSSCIEGAYQTSTNETIVIHGITSPRYRNVTTGKAGRMLLSDNATYSLSQHLSDNQPGSATIKFSPDCDRLSITNKHSRQPVTTADKISMQVTETTFVSEGIELAGRFVVPQGNGPFPYVVLVHGSGPHSGLSTFYHQYGFPAYGIAAFVFDKRGTGLSAGKMTNNFNTLAVDAAAALRHVRKSAPTKVASAGFSGYSQGGWISPLAASKSDRADFVIVNYAMVNSSLYEDKQQAMCELKKQGFTNAQMKTAGQAIDRAHQIIVNGFKDGYQRQAAALRKDYQHEPWFGKFEGEFSGEVLTNQISDSLRNDDLSFDYDSRETLDMLSVPMLWMLAGSDKEAPPNMTANYLARRAHSDSSTSMLIHRDTDHGFVYFQNVNGKRQATHYAPDLFKIKADWIKDGFKQRISPQWEDRISQWGWCLD